LSLLRVRGRTQSTNADNNYHDNRSENRAASFHQNSQQLFHGHVLEKFSDCDGLLRVAMHIFLRGGLRCDRLYIGIACQPKDVICA